MSEPSPLNIALGGERLTVRLLASEKPTKEILIRYLPIRLMHLLDELQTKEPELVELFADQPPGWADNVHPDDFVKILEKGQELNFPIRDQWLQRQLKVAERKVAEMEALLKKLPTEMQGPLRDQLAILQRQLLVKSALSSSSAVSAAQTPSASSASATSSSSTSS